MEMTCKIWSKNHIITFKINISLGTVTEPVLQLVPELISDLVPELVPELFPELVRENMKMPFYVRLGVKIK